MAGRGRPFPKGISGNPAGGPRGPRPHRTMRVLCAEHRQLVTDTLVELTKGAEDERVRLAAALALADRSDGKPRNEAPAEDEDEHDSGPRQTLEQLEAKYAKEGNGSWPDESSSDGDA